MTIFEVKEIEGIKMDCERVAAKCEANKSLPPYLQKIIALVIKGGKQEGLYPIAEKALEPFVQFYGEPAAQYPNKMTLGTSSYFNPEYILEIVEDITNTKLFKTIKEVMQEEEETEEEVGSFLVEKKILRAKKETLEKWTVHILPNRLLVVTTTKEKTTYLLAHIENIKERYY